MKNLVFGMVAVSILAMAQMEKAEAGKYSATLGAGVSVSPDYEGSDDYKVRGMPFISLGWKADADMPEDGTDFQLGLHDVTLKMPGSLEVGVGRLYRPEGMYRFNLGLKYNRGRNQDNNQALDGMGDIDGHMLAKAGISFKTKGPGWRYSLSYSQDLSNETDGSTVDGELGYFRQLGKKLSLTPYASASWADQDHMQSYFGVSQAQAVTSSNAQFDADSGIKSVGLGVKLNWKISGDWKLKNTLGYIRLTNDAADSPLVKSEGSADQFRLRTALVYTF